MAEYVKDSWATGIVDGSIQDDRYIVVNDLIIYKGRIYLISASGMKITILRAFHDAPMAGHPGFFKTYKQVQERFTWKGLKSDVLQYVRECPICQQNKQEHTYPAGLLQPLPIPDKKWECLSMDFITGLPKAQGRNCIYVVVDRLTKFAHFFPITSTYTAIQVAELFFQEVFRLHGLPRNIVSDRDSRFMTHFW